MTETKETQLIVITPEEKQIKNIGEITAYMESLNEIAEKAKLAKITDKNSLAIVDGIAKSAKKLKSNLNSKKLEITKEWRDNTSTVNGLVKRMMEPIEIAIEESSSKVVAYKEILEREAKKRQQELEAKQRRLDHLVNSLESIIPQFQGDLNKAKTLDEISLLSKNYVSTKNPESWNSRTRESCKEFTEYEEKIDPIIEQMVSIGKARRSEIEAINAGNEKKAKEIESQREDIANHAAEKVSADIISSDNTEAIEISSQLSVASNAKQSGIRKDWQYEVTDLNKVSREFLMIDDKVVKHYMSTYKDRLDEQPLAGIIFNQVSRHVSR